VNVIRELSPTELDAWIDTVTAARAAGRLIEVHGRAYPCQNWSFEPHHDDVRHARASLHRINFRITNKERR